MRKPTIVIGKAEHTYVIDHTQWISILGDGRKVTISSHPYAFLVFLTLPLSEINRLRHDACIAAGVSEHECPCLPVYEIIKAGLLSNSQDWQTLALQRLKETENQGVFLAELDRLVAHGQTQKIRHLALKLRAKLKHQQQN